jgi:hypothetical protein
MPISPQLIVWIAIALVQVSLLAIAPLLIHWLSLLP